MPSRLDQIKEGDWILIYEGTNSSSNQRLTEILCRCTEIVDLGPTDETKVERVYTFVGIKSDKSYGNTLSVDRRRVSTDQKGLTFTPYDDFHARLWLEENKVMTTFHTQLQTAQSALVTAQDKFDVLQSYFGEKMKVIEAQSQEELEDFRQNVN